MATQFRVVVAGESGWKQFVETFDDAEAETFIREAIERGHGVTVTEREVSEYEPSHQWDSLFDDEAKEQYSKARAAA